MRLSTRLILSISIALSAASGVSLAGDDARGGEVGLLAGVAVPDEDLTLDPDTTVEATFGLRGGSVFASRWGWFVDVLATEVESLGPSGNAMTFVGRTGLELLMQPQRNRRWFLAGGPGWMVVDYDDDPGQDFHRPIASIGIGQRIPIGGNRRFRWEIRGDHTLDDVGLSGRDLSRAYFLAGLSWGPGTGAVRERTAIRPAAESKPRRKAPIDSDGDGVLDKKDACPNTMRGAPVDRVGCSTDADADGVPDGIDRCDQTETGRLVGPDGCARDTDGDGVPDESDVCPNTRRHASTDEWGCARDGDRDGVPDGIDRCPLSLSGERVDAEGCSVDTDGDGVPDGIDRCEQTPPGTEVNARGCLPDKDEDGVTDRLDRCPNSPHGSSVDAAGCPEAAPVFEPGRQRVVLEGTRFETASAVLTEASTTVLDRVARSLLANREIRVEIAGHTDSVGDAASNLKLSAERAAAVRRFLVQAGVAPSRLVARGYGETTPIADNRTAEGRARNRRVELVRVD